MKGAFHALAAALMCGGMSLALAQDLWLRQPDGKLVRVIEDNGAADPWHQSIERRNPDGSLDRFFGTGGLVSFTLGADSLGPRSVRIDAQGRLFVVGAAFGSADRSAAAIARFLPDGRTDWRWGARGTSLLGSAEGNVQGLDVLALPDENVLVLGQVESVGVERVVLWRLRPDGSVDPEFGQAGALRAPLLDGAQTMSLRLDEDGGGLIAAQRSHAGGLLLEVHKWQPGAQGIQLVARQFAPSGWQGTVRLEHREGRWQWTDSSGAASLPVVRIAEAGSPAESLGQALFNPFTVQGAATMPAVVSEPERDHAPGSAWLWLAPALALLGFAAWRRRSMRTADLGLIDSRSAMLDAAMTDLARLTPAAVDERSSQKTAAADTEAKLPACRNGLERPLFGPRDDLKRIKGIGPVLEKRLHGEGIFYFWQIAQWRPEDMAEVGARLSGFRGRIERDRWVAQAVELSS